MGYTSNFIFPGEEVILFGSAQCEYVVTSQSLQGANSPSAHMTPNPASLPKSPP